MNRKMILACLVIMLAALPALTNAGADEEVDWQTDASGQWMYAFAGSGAVIIGNECELGNELTIPSELDGYPVTGIGLSAFFSSGKLERVTIPDSVTAIDNYAFYDCPRLKRVSIPASVEHIGLNPFMGSPVEFIDVSPDNPYFEQVDGVLYEKRRKLLISYPFAREGAYEIPEGSVIGEWAFSRCGSLTGVTIPDGTDIISTGAFGWCESLTDVTLPDSVTKIGVSAFRDCTGLTSLVIPVGVTEIGSSAFDGCDNITLIVAEGSYAKQYATENGIAYTIAE